MARIKYVVSTAAVGLLAVSAVSVWAGSPQASGAAGRASSGLRPAVPVTMAVPGTPEPPTLVWTEPFENGLGTPAHALRYGTVLYTGSSGETYTGSPGWLNPGVCNGLLMAGETATAPGGNGTVTVGGASCVYSDQLRQLATTIGNVNGSAVPSANHVVSAFTAGNPGAGWVAQLQQLKSLPAGINRFLALSVNFAAMNCGVASPQYLFAYSKDNTTWTDLGGAVAACTSPNATAVTQPALGTMGASAAKVGRIYSPQSILMNSASIAVRVGNNNGSGAGNDAAFDDLTVWDVTPTIDKAFSPTTIAANGVSTLTLRVTNTSDLAAKAGWGFTDTFPAGLKVANPPTVSTTCGTGTSVNAVAGAGSFTVSGGNLTLGTASCLVKLNVTAAADGSYANGASNISSAIGLNLPASPATLTVFTPTPKLAITKVASPTAVTTAGQTVNYTITAKNTGNVALTNVTVSDTKVTGLSCTPTIPAATLAIGGSISCQGSYIATQADIDAGTIANTATGSATGGVSGTGSATVTATRLPALSVSKSVSPTQFINAGETLSYTITAKNTGNVSLSNVSVSDPKVGTLSCSPTIPVAKLAPNAQIVCTGSRIVTSGDVTSGVFTNTASSTGTPPSGSAITATGSATATGQPKNPHLLVTKSASPTAMTTVGETITYTISAKNDGDVTLTDVNISDPKVSGLTCSPALPVASLAIGATVACQGTHVVTQTDLDNSPLVNTVTATGDSIVGAATGGTAQATVTTSASPALTVAKTVSPTSFLLAGETLNYQIRATNSGNVTLTNVSISDPKVNGLNCAPALPVAALAPGTQIVCTGTRIVTNADVIAGSIVNTATASGKAPGGATVNGSGTATANGTPQNPKLDVTKSALPTTFSRVGDRVSYTVTAVNSGNVPLSNVTVSDTKVAGLTCTPALPVATLSAGDSITCLGTSVVTQANIDAGSILNTATATGTPPLGGPISNSASVTVPGPAAEPKLALAKSASPVTYSAAGDMLTYTLVSTNTGNVTLTNVSVSDPGVSSLSCSAALPVASLAPGATITCTGSRAVTQAEVDGGSVSNTASTSGTAPGSVPVSASASNTVNGLPAVPRLSVAKTAAQAAFDGVDSEINYTLTLTNIGTATLKELSVSDTLATPSCTPLLTGLQLAPGEKVTCTYAHTVTGLEATVGQVDNTASASGKSLSDVPTSDSSTLVTPGPIPAPRLSVSKVADPAVFGEAGGTVSFTIVATNTGNIPLTNVTVSDPGLTLTCDLMLPVAELAVGASIRCSAERVITQADVDRGSMSNIASASGSDLLGNPVDGAAAVTVPGPAARPSLAIVKRASTGSVSTAGELVQYSFEVTNNGNITIDGVTVNDPLVSNLVCPQSTLAPDQSMLCSATYLTTQSDVDGGSIANLATATGTPARGSLTPATDTALVAAERRPALSLTKSASPSTFRVEGDEITYTIVATNTGNVTLFDVSITDPKVTLACSPTAPVATLAPAASLVCTGTATVSDVDVATGSISNTASTAATAPGGVNLSDTATSQVDGPIPEPRLSLTKSASPSVFAAVGQTVTYTLVATNTGNVSLTEVTISDPFLTDIRCASSNSVRLAPNASLTCTGAHTVTQVELDRGTIPNTASVSGRTPLDAPVSGNASLTIDGLPPVPELTVVKTATPAAYVAEGDLITWTIITTNTGTATLSGVTVEDAAGAVTCGETLPLATLAPGEVLTCTVQSTVSAVDVERGSVTNTASASASAPDGAPVSASDTAAADGPVPNPRLSLVKTSSGAFTGPGDSVTFTIVATNTGNVELRGVTLSDPGLALSCDPTLPVAVLEVGASITCTAKVLTTQADVDAGSIHNEVTGSGSTPLSVLVTAQAAVDVPGPAPGPALAMVKRASVGTVSAVGEAIGYTFELTNSGNVSIGNIVVSDPRVSDLSCGQSVLGAGQTTLCTATYVATQTDLDRGSIVNVATVTGTPARGSLPAGEASSVVNVAQRPALVLAKSVLPVAFRAAGELLTYTAVATNTGNVSLTNVSVSDPLVSDLSCTPSSPAAVLAPGASLLCLGSYVVTQLDVDNGTLSNTASGSGTSPLGDSVPASATVTAPGPASAPELSLSKVANEVSYSIPGDRLNYTLVATNTGNVTLNNVSVSDAKLAGLSCSPAQPVSLEPGAALTCTGYYAVTQEDVDGGTVSNSASASGSPRGGSPVTGAASADVNGIPPNPRLSVSKRSAPAAFTAAGDEITWAIVVRNTGLATLTGVDLSDSLGEPVCDSPLPLDSFAPGASLTCSYSTTVSASDVERGSIINTATASANGPDGVPVSASDTRAVDGPAPGPRLSVVKSALPASFSTAGETVVFTVVATNTGNVELRNVSVVDPGRALDCDVELPAGVLAPGQAITCTVSVLTTLDDVNAGTLHNEASAAGETPLGVPVTGQASIDVPGPVATPALSLVKTGTPAKIINAGQAVVFTFTVTNTGNVTVSNVQVNDPRLDAPAVCEATSLVPGAATTCTGTYTVQAADLHGNGLVNSASASGDAARGATRSAVDSLRVPSMNQTLPPTGGGGGMMWALLILAVGLALFVVTRRPRFRWCR